MERNMIIYKMGSLYELPGLTALVLVNRFLLLSF